MQPLDLATIRKHLERAADDIDYFLGDDNKRENAREEAGKRYDLMDELLDEGWTPPKGKARGKHRLTKTQYNALVHRTTVYGNPLTDEKREAILADLDLEHVEVPTSDAGREAFAFWARGGWLESSRQAAIWLQKAEETVAADGIDEALSGLPGEPRDATERPAYREAMRTEAGQVRTILTTCLEEAAPPVKSQPPADDARGAAGGGKEETPEGPADGDTGGVGKGDEQKRQAYGVNYDRDAWLFSLCVADVNLTWQQLEDKLEGIAAEKGWTPITARGLRQALKTYCAFIGHEVPKLKSGQRKKN